MNYQFSLKKQELFVDIDMNNERIEGGTNMNISLYMPIYYLYDEEDFNKNNFDLKNIRIRSPVDKEVHVEEDLCARDDTSSEDKESKENKANMANITNIPNIANIQNKKDNSFEKDF
ncbi:hypothetical protein PMLGA01_030023200, partial [Plasmodium malariae]